MSIQTEYDDYVSSIAETEPRSGFCLADMPQPSGADLALVIRARPDVLDGLLDDVNLFADAFEQTEMDGVFAGHQLMATIRLRMMGNVTRTLFDDVTAESERRSEAAYESSLEDGELFRGREADAYYAYQQSQAMALK